MQIGDTIPIRESKNILNFEEYLLEDLDPDYETILEQNDFYEPIEKVDKIDNEVSGYKSYCIDRIKSAIAQSNQRRIEEKKNKLIKQYQEQLQDSPSKNVDQSDGSLPPKKKFWKLKDETNTRVAQSNQRRQEEKKTELKTSNQEQLQESRSKNVDKSDGNLPHKNMFQITIADINNILAKQNQRKQEEKQTELKTSNQQQLQESPSKNVDNDVSGYKSYCIDRIKSAIAQSNQRRIEEKKNKLIKQYQEQLQDSPSKNVDQSDGSLPPKKKIWKLKDETNTRVGQMKQRRQEEKKTELKTSNQEQLQESRSKNVDKSDPPKEKFWKLMDEINAILEQMKQRKKEEKKTELKTSNQEQLQESPSKNVDKSDGNLPHKNMFLDNYS